MRGSSKLSQLQLYELEAVKFTTGLIENHLNFVWLTRNLSKFKTFEKQTWNHVQWSVESLNNKFDIQIIFHYRKTSSFDTTYLHMYM